MNEAISLTDGLRPCWAEFWRFTHRWTGVAFVLAVGAAELAGQAKPVTPQQREQEAVVFRQTIDAAAAGARRGDLDVTERALESLGKTSANSAARHIETAQHLLHLADKLAREGETARGPSLALRALQQLALADGKPARPSVRSAAKSLAGFIQERYLGDRAAALESYRAAAQALPVTSRATRAKEAIDRLERSGSAQKTNQPAPGR